MSLSDERPNPEISAELLAVMQRELHFATTELSHWTKLAVNNEMSGEIVVKMPCLKGRFGAPKVGFEYVRPREDGKK